MDKVIMPELITPKLAEIMASNPDILNMLVSHQPGEEVIVGQDCTLDCSGNPTNVKLVFCNVTIEVDGTGEECNNGCEHREKEKHDDNRCCEADYKDYNQGCIQYRKLPVDMSRLLLEIAVLEARMLEIQKILKLIPRQVSNRKLVARCKRDINEVEEQLAAKKKQLEYKAGI